MNLGQNGVILVDKSFDFSIFFLFANAHDLPTLSNISVLVHALGSNLKPTIASFLLVVSLNNYSLSPLEIGYLHSSLCVLVAQSCQTVCDPMSCSPPGLLCPWNSSRKEY